MANLLKEHRKFLRFPVSIPVNFENRKDNLSTICSNISQKGIYIETSERLKKGDVLCINLDISPRNVKLLGEVKWTARTELKGYDNKKIRGFGIKFLANMKETLDLSEGILEKDRWKPSPEKEGPEFSAGAFRSGF